MYAAWETAAILEHAAYNSDQIYLKHKKMLNYEHNNNLLLSTQCWLLGKRTLTQRFVPVLNNIIIEQVYQKHITILSSIISYNQYLVRFTPVKRNRRARFPGGKPKDETTKLSGYPSSCAKLKFPLNVSSLSMKVENFNCKTKHLAWSALAELCAQYV